MNVGWFLKHEEINGGEVCPTYLHRWTLLKIRGWVLYLHKFVGDDWSRDFHDHPSRFWSIGLWGRYVEETPSLVDGPRYPAKTLYRAPWVRSFPAEHRHRIVLTGKRRPCWTLAIHGPQKRKWGFWQGSRFIPWRLYVDEEAASNRTCE